MRERLICCAQGRALHNPVADEECGLALIETVTTLHTRDVKTPLSKSIAELLAG